MARDNIRNFCIIAHIDHGKSTLSDRILELTKSVDERTMEDQILDNMDIERERGITIKARAVTMNYTAKDGKTYEFNLIDTPGHVDFAYEVSRSLAACEGAILVVDATQGVEAQTLANTYMALEHDLELVPILNKIDLPSAHPDEVAQEVEDVIGLPCMDAPRVSAKTGLNVDQVLERVVSDIPAPTGDPDAPLKALIFDSIYDSYKGVIVYIRVFEGTVKPGDTVRIMATGAEFTLVEVGRMGATSLMPCDHLEAGEVGSLTASIKNVRETRVGDTVTLVSDPTPEPLPGYRKVTPMVFCGIYTVDGAKYPDLKDALEKLQLNDASLSFEPETSAALGFGFRCGFLGLLHLDIITQRLEREDEVYKSYGILKYARKITEKDARIFLSQLMAGEEDGLVRFDRQCSLYKLMLGIKSANLNLWASRPLDKEELDVIVCSDLARSYDTAMAVARQKGLQPVATPLLREMDWGIYTGKVADEMDFTTLPESVETIEALYKRAGDFVDFLKKEFPGKRILAIGHGGFNRAIIVQLEKLPPEKILSLPIMKNTACMRFTLP